MTSNNLQHRYQKPYLSFSLTAPCPECDTKLSFLPELLAMEENPIYHCINCFSPVKVDFNNGDISLTPTTLPK